MAASLQKNQITIVRADLRDGAHQRAIVDLTAMYHRDPMGAGSEMDPSALEMLLDGLQRSPTCAVLLAYIGDEAVGIATCFLGFSTFAARPVLNIHDLAVKPSFRRLGAGRLLLQPAQAFARAQNCCKLTLEVRQDNGPAQNLYRDFGFGPGGAPMMFWNKRLS